MATCITPTTCPENTISVVNSRAAATLAAAATFQGTSEDISAYGRVGISITSSNATDGTLWIEVSHDNVTFSTIPRTFANTSIAEPHMWNIVEQYFRIRYVNGTTEATALSIQVQYSTNADTILGHQLDGALIDETEAQVTRSVLVGKDEVLGTYDNVSVVTKDGKTSLYTVAGFSHTYTVHLDFTITPNSIDFPYMLIDLSDTTNWKHNLTGEIVVEYILLEVDPAATFSGDVKIGFLENVDATDGDFHALIDIDMATKSDLVVENIDFGSHGMHCTSSHHFVEVDTANTLFQTDVNIKGTGSSTVNAYPSGNGDLVMVVTGNNNEIGVSVTIGYETVA